MDDAPERSVRAILIIIIVVMTAILGVSYLW
jgi:hypothetical protein